VDRHGRRGSNARRPFSFAVHRATPLNTDQRQRRDIERVLVHARGCVAADAGDPYVEEVERRRFTASPLAATVSGSPAKHSK
jgi:hypothetical protein